VIISNIGNLVLIYDEIDSKGALRSAGKSLRMKLAMLASMGDYFYYSPERDWLTILRRSTGVPA
jgi:hypothetical protein